MGPLLSADQFPCVGCRLSLGVTRVESRDGVPEGEDGTAGDLEAVRAGICGAGRAVWRGADGESFSDLGPPLT